jgi:hypothetical protein
MKAPASVCRWSGGLMEAYVGSLDLQSDKGVGTTETVRFPKERVVTSEVKL